MKTTSKKILTNDRYENVVTHIGLRKSMHAVEKISDMYNPYYHGYKGCVDAILPYVDSDIDSQIAITDDFGLQMISALKEKGYHNFTMLLTDLDEKMQKYIVYYIEHVYSKEELKDIQIKTLEECKNMKFDLIISNPPYEVGNVITKKIIDNIDFDKFINLMPLVKYKSAGLFSHISSKVGSINSALINCFDDAKTAPDICLLSKNKTLYRDYDEFEVSFYYDQRLGKFYKENYYVRKPTYVKHICICASHMFSQINSKNSFACGIYTPHDKVHAMKQLKTKFTNSKDVENFLLHPSKKLTRDCSEEYVWNFIKPNCSLDKCFVPVASGNINQIITIFSSEIEKDNFVNWWYSAERNGKNPKSGLASILLAGLNKPTGCPFSFAIPRVDWSRPWTDEEILKDYGYSDKEIKQILDLGKNDLYRHALADFQ